MQTITCLVTDNYPNTPNPLIYTVQVAGLDDATVLAAVTEARRADLGCKTEDLDLELLLAFAGDIHPIADWRQ